MENTIKITCTRENLEKIAAGLSAARCGMESLVRFAEQYAPDSAALYAAWFHEFMEAETLIPQSEYNDSVTLVA